MAWNYCETIVCSVINSAFALQLLQDIMIHVSLSSCYGCLRKLVEICTYCFPFYSPSSSPPRQSLSSGTISSFIPHCMFELLFADRGCYIYHVHKHTHKHTLCQFALGRNVASLAENHCSKKSRVFNLLFEQCFLKASLVPNYTIHVTSRLLLPFLSPQDLGV